MYLSRLVLKNIRGFENLELDFKGEGPLPRLNTLILGRNGTCKTSALRAIALALTDLSGTSALLEAPNGGFVRRATDRAEIESWLVDGSGVPWKGGGGQIVLARQDGREFPLNGRSQPVPGLFVCGYGVGRWGFGGSSRTFSRNGST